LPAAFDVRRPLLGQIVGEAIEVVDRLDRIIPAKIIAELLPSSDIAIHAPRRREDEVRVKPARAFVDAQPILLQARPFLCLGDLARERPNDLTDIMLREIEKAITEDDPQAGLSVSLEEVQTVREPTQFMPTQAMPERGSPYRVINTIMGAHNRLGLAPAGKPFTDNGLDFRDPRRRSITWNQIITRLHR
jgi:hypothetical protein